MFKHMRMLGLACASIMLSSTLSADQQVMKVEEMLSKKNKLNADISVAYYNIDQKTALTTIVPVSTLLSYIYVPVYAGEQVVDQDLIVGSVNIKYGVLDWLEISAFADGHSTSSRVKLGTELQGNSDLDFDYAGVGLTAKVKDEGNYPSLLLGLTANVISRLTYVERDGEGTPIDTKKQDEFLETFSLYALSYYTVDPIVFVLKASYQFTLEKTFQDNTIDRPDVLAISPQIYFAVNPYTNLSWGVTYQYQTEQRFNGQAETNAESLLGLSLGMSYEISRGNILSVETTKNDSSSYGQSSVNFIYSKRF